MAERLLASRVADGRGRGHHGPLTFDHLAAWYLDDYLVRRLRTVDTARGRVANLRATFGGQPATVMTTEAIRSYQRTRLAAGVAAATVNRETSALSRMLQLAIWAGALDHRPVFPERLEERGPRQGFFEHADYEAVRRHLPPAYQDVLDFAYYSGWRKREILELRWSEVDEGGGVVRLSPERSKTRVGRVLPIVPPIAAVLARRRAQRQGEDPVVFRRDAVTVRAWRTAWPEACRRAGVPGPHGPRWPSGTDRDEFHPSVSRWPGHGHAAPGGRAGLARLPVVLSGNARTPRVADRGPGHAEAWRAVPHDVGRRVRTPGTQCRRTRLRPGRRGADVRRRPWHTHPRGRSRTPLARPAGTPRRASLA